MIQEFDPLKWVLTFIPEKIDGKPLDLISIDRFVSDCKNGKNNFKTNYCSFDIDYKTTKQFKAHWILLAKDVLGGDDLVNGTRDKKYKIQNKMVKEAGYEIPSLIDVITSFFMHHLVLMDQPEKEKFIYSESTFTHVPERIMGSGEHIVVGGCSRFSLYICPSPSQGANIGAAYSWKSISY